MEVVVIDYGMGNLWSVLSAFRYLGVDATLSNDPTKIAASPVLVLPGVGSFRKAMEALHERQLEPAILDAVKKPGTKILGICLGMQLLAASSTEDGETKGLGLIPNRVKHFTPEEAAGNKIPHVGFNQVRFAPPTGFFAGLSDAADFYFVHSYRMLRGGLVGDVGICHYGIDFLAAFRTGNVFGAQFHPEKSQTNGLVLLKNFLEA